MMSKCMMVQDNWLICMKLGLVQVHVLRILTENKWWNFFVPMEIMRGSFYHRNYKLK